MQAAVTSNSTTKRPQSHANGHSNGIPNTRPKSLGLQPLAPIVHARLLKKYRHVAAVHSKERAACLSHDSVDTPSFLGFRNLMVIVLGMSLHNDVDALY